MSEAIAWYSRSVSSQNDWPQFHHVCYWELYWASMFSCRWSKAVKYADLLLQDSKWSKCMYAYLKAAAMCMMQGELTEEERQQQIQLMRQVSLFVGLVGVPGDHDELGYPVESGKIPVTSTRPSTFSTKLTYTFPLPVRCLF